MSDTHTHSSLLIHCDCFFCFFFFTLIELSALLDWAEKIDSFFLLAILQQLQDWSVTAAQQCPFLVPIFTSIRSVCVCVLCVLCVVCVLVGWFVCLFVVVLLLFLCVEFCQILII